MLLNKFSFLAFTTLMVSATNSTISVMIKMDESAAYLDNTELHLGAADASYNTYQQGGPTEFLLHSWNSQDVDQAGKEVSKQIVIYGGQQSSDVKYDLTCVSKPLGATQNGTATYEFFNQDQLDQVRPNVDNKDIASLVCSQDGQVLYDSQDI